MCMAPKSRAFSRFHGPPAGSFWLISAYLRLSFGHWSAFQLSTLHSRLLRVSGLQGTAQNTHHLESQAYLVGIRMGLGLSVSRIVVSLLAIS